MHSFPPKKQHEGRHVVLIFAKNFFVVSLVVHVLTIHFEYAFKPIFYVFNFVCKKISPISLLSAFVSGIKNVSALYATLRFSSFLKL